MARTRRVVATIPLKKISPSQINSFLDCPCCYYKDRVAKDKRPRGITAGLPMGIDRVFRVHYRAHAAAGTIPKELKATFGPGWSLSTDSTLVSKEQSFDQPDELLIKGVNYTLAGRMDEMLMNPKNEFVIVDFKTKASAKSSANVHPTAERQMQLYALILESQGRKVADVAYLAHLYPDVVDDGPDVKFVCQLHKINVDATARAAARKMFERTVKCLTGPEPKKKPKCEFCNFRA